ncbi:aminoacyl-tRNA hydrolase [Nakamurella flavida]|uniref:Peptidyl-tRNA hydrolase n=1 Tax=Nakamurella flavida TaxID=363630 RepID=A0A938YM85_9ACTN|nr:aminoacyl-tRNA hydrolase [Nakamurella flavida]MBM9477288.1 aminoacyl-tRNA hydrolase [Nakamurella flavida]MDP9779744.1 PTH1 family peptidyl-tRNA hydrolase [Nakamurella flavida]
MSDPWIVVGLGNPGPAYATHRHNVGAMVAGVLADRIGSRLGSSKTGCDVAEGRLGGQRLVVAVPRSFMNVSGPPVAKLVRFYSVTPDRLIVVHDELDLAAETIRVKQGGGEGGHNGLRSISASLGTKDYLRVRFGIGRPPGRMDPADFVLRGFASTEKASLAVDLERAADAVEMLTEHGLLETQNRLH